VTETYFGSSKNQIAHAVSLDTNHANAFVDGRRQLAAHPQTWGGESSCPTNPTEGEPK
jgi:hypothetical protein